MKKLVLFFTLFLLTGQLTAETLKIQNVDIGIREGSEFTYIANVETDSLTVTHFPATVSVDVEVNKAFHSIGFDLVYQDSATLVNVDSVVWGNVFNGKQQYATVNHFPEEKRVYIALKLPNNVNVPNTGRHNVLKLIFLKKETEIWAKFYLEASQ